MSEDWHISIPTFGNSFNRNDLFNHTILIKSHAVKQKNLIKSCREDKKVTLEQLVKYKGNSSICKQNSLNFIATLLTL